VSLQSVKFFYTLERIETLCCLSSLLLGQILVPSSLCARTSGELVDLINATNVADSSGLEFALAQVDTVNRLTPEGLARIAEAAGTSPIERRQVLDRGMPILLFQRELTISGLASLVSAAGEEGVAFAKKWTPSVRHLTPEGLAAFLESSNLRAGQRIKVAEAGMQRLGRLTLLTCLQLSQLSAALMEKGAAFTLRHLVRVGDLSPQNLVTLIESISTKDFKRGRLEVAQKAMAHLGPKGGEFAIANMKMVQGSMAGDLLR